MTTHHGINNMRLEVETPAAGLPNLVQNPSGDKGAWYYLTPVANTKMTKVMSGDESRLQFTTTAAQASNFTTEFMPLAVGQYVAARFQINAISASHNVKCRFEFYNSAKVLLSSSTQTGALSALQVHYVASQLAPANTVYVKLRWDFYNGTGNPSANSSVTFRQVMVTHADTADGLGSTRTNLITNPSFEVNTTGWTAEEPGRGTNPTLARVSTPTPVSGTYSMRATATVRDSVWVVSNSFSVTGGKNYTFSADVRAATNARTVYLRFRWYNSAGTELTHSQKNVGVDSNSAWTRKTYTATAPSRAVTCKATIIWSQCNDNEQHYVDAVLVETATIIEGAYFDGSFPAGGGKTYAWTGTAHASRSTEVADLSAYDFTEPNDWRNILGPTHDISVTRESLDVSLLSAEILDEMLDPSVEDDLRPGKKIRLRVLKGDNIWYSIYEGRVTSAQVTYIPTTRVFVTASDNIAQLANQIEPNGVATIGALPHILEGKGVPWNVNGSGNQVSSASIIAVNENASVLDQVAITRDSQLGFAWVDRENVLNVRDRDAVANLLTYGNSGTFETDISGWVGHRGTASRSTTVARTGVASLRMYHDFGNQVGNAAQLSTRISVTEGSIYTLKAWTRAHATTRKARVALEFYNSSGTLLSQAFSPDTSTNDSSAWEERTVTAAAPAGAATVNLWLEVYSDSQTLPVGELHYWDDVTLDGPSAADPLVPVIDLDETRYSNFDLSFSTEDCINEVLVKYLRYSTKKKETEEIPYGPYSDSASIDMWGARRAEFTYQGTESSTAIADFADAILTANANPRVRINSVTLPVRTTLDIDELATLDLYDYVTVANTDRAVFENSYITGLTHSITPDRWMIEVRFSDPDSVASPTVTASPPASSTNDSARAGMETVSFAAINTTYTRAVTFNPPFSSAPSIVVTPDIGSPQNITTSIDGVSVNGFSIVYRRSSGTADTNIHWIALPRDA